MERMTVDPLRGRTVTVQFGPGAKGHAESAEVTLYPGRERPSVVRMIGPCIMVPGLDSHQSMKVPARTKVSQVTQGWTIYNLDTPLTLVPGREYSLAFDPACSPALICTDDQGNQYSSDARMRVKAQGPQYVGISQFMSDQLAKQGRASAKVLADLANAQSDAYAKAMREMVKMAKRGDWAAPLKPYTETLTTNAIAEAVEALRGDGPKDRIGPNPNNPHPRSLGH